MGTPRVVWMVMAMVVGLSFAGRAADASQLTRAQAHVQNIGWMQLKCNALGPTLQVGTAGQGLQMEDLYIALYP